MGARAISGQIESIDAGWGGEEAPTWDGSCPRADGKNPSILDEAALEQTFRADVAHTRRASGPRRRVTLTTDAGPRAQTTLVQRLSD